MWPWNGPLERAMSGTRELIRSIPATDGSNNGAGGRGRVCRASQEYSLVQKNSSMFELPAFLPPPNLGLPMHSPSALTEHVSLNLARFFLLDPVLSKMEEGRIGQGSGGRKGCCSWLFLSFVFCKVSRVREKFVCDKCLPSLPSSPSPPPLSCPRQHSRETATRGAVGSSRVARSLVVWQLLACSRTEEKFDGWFLHRTKPPPPPQLRV